MGEPKFENLVFEGGGVRGVAYAGALKVFEEQGLLPGVRRVAGASAGAFAALLLSLGYSSDRLKDALRSIHFKTLEDKPNPLRVVSHYGLYKGDVLHDWILRQVTNLGLPESLTFEGLNERGGRDLTVFATDLTTCNTREFSFEQTPQTSVVGAVRASMSIPLMYAAWQFPGGEPDDHVYVDGGVAYNYPIGAFDAGDVNSGTLGFRFVRGGDSAQIAEHQPHNFFEYAKNLFAAVMSAQNINFEHDPAQVRRSVLIDDLGFRATDLSLSDADFNRLYASGYEATKRYLGGLG
ncbi:patatin-like phospholipase family protein [Kordiimonas sp.]|uniref:patatin-like phospholipase family protein n=1 Tax=Kordiimonas sp. TaxID=1970157 RepID=UPI003B52EEDF